MSSRTTVSIDSNIPTPQLSRRWWFESELLALLLLVLCCCGLRMTSISIRGEESRRGRIAWEMSQTGEWVVPRIQGGVVFYRPPLQNWLIALAGKISGKVDAFAVRFPTLIAMLLTTILIYGYSRTFLSRWGAFASGTAFVTFGQVLELGRLGETEALFTLFIAGSLLLWKSLLNRGASPFWIWSVGYGVNALAVLTKGPQAPTYFIGSLLIFLVLTRRWRLLFSVSHVCGLIVGALIIAAWQIPFAGEVGATQSWKVYFRDVGPRFFNLSFSSVATHMATFPLELIFGALLPWSLLLVCLVSPRFRAALGALKEDCLFCAVCIAVTFPSVWITPGASLRYYMPIYPMFAILVGIVLDRLATDSVLLSAWNTSLRRYWRGIGLVIVGYVLWIAAISIGRPQWSWSQPLWLALVLLMVGAACGITLWRGSKNVLPGTLWKNVVIVSWFMALVNTVVLVNIRMKISADAPSAIAHLKETLPPGTQLESIGPAHHLFLFHLREQVTELPPPESIVEPPHASGYFCLTIKNGVIPPLPFSWKQIATIPCDRNRHAKPVDQVVVGQILPAALAEGGSE